jgi:hypothetical protein
LFSVERGPHGLLEFALDPTSKVGRATTKTYDEALGFIDRVLGAMWELRARLNYEENVIA